MSFEEVIEQPSIPTDRLVLRPLEASDAGLIEMYGSDKRVAFNTSSIPHPLPPGSAQAFITRATAAERSEDVWAIDAINATDDESGAQSRELVGLISLERMDRGQSEVGYWVAPAYWNTGVASEAVEALIRANPQANRTIFASVFQDNPASARVLTNAGFDYIGDAESFSVARDAAVPTWTYLKKLD
ncbi:MAG: GNAT family N-acetyltransferase [Paracoccaceae bacterium]